MKSLRYDAPFNSEEARVVHVQLAVLVSIVFVFVAPAQEKVPKPVLVLVEIDESTSNRVSLRLRLDPERSTEIDIAWMNNKWAVVGKHADDMIADAEKKHRGYALKYLALLELKKDRKLANRVAVQATKNLGGEPRELAAFVNKALYADPTAVEYQLALMATTPLIADSREIVSVRIAHLCALVGCGKVREAMVTNRTIVDDLSGKKEDLIALATAICDVHGGRALGAIARRAFDLGRKDRPASESLQMLEYRILYDLEGNRKASTKVGLKLVEAAKESTLNNWLWYLMTRRSTAGKYNSLALIAAREMQKGGNLAYGNMDTVALALFENGLLDEALALQEEAVKKGGSGTSAGIRRRLEVFRAAKKKRDAKIGETKKR